MERWSVGDTTHMNVYVVMNLTDKRAPSPT